MTTPTEPTHHIQLTTAEIADILDGLGHTHFWLSQKINHTGPPRRDKAATQAERDQAQTEHDRIHALINRFRELTTRD